MTPEETLNLLRDAYTKEGPTVAFFRKEFGQRAADDVADALAHAKRIAPREDPLQIAKLILERWAVITGESK